MTFSSERSVISSILPADARACETFDVVAGATLFRDEAAGPGHMAASRRRELTTSRTLARLALEQIGVPAVAIPIGPNREPQWPKGVVGSITHCEGYCAAAVARRSCVTAIGIDAEIHAPLPDDVREVVVREEERTWIGMQRDWLSWDVVLFSAKESVFKAWFPLTGVWLDFTDVSVVVDRDAAKFQARLVKGPLIINGRAIEGFAGRYLVHGCHVMTSVALGPLMQNTDTGVE